MSRTPNRRGSGAPCTTKPILAMVARKRAATCVPVAFYERTEVTDDPTGALPCANDRSLLVILPTRQGTCW
jgi:hypothetical protein